MITAILHVSASSLAQKVTLAEKNAPLFDVFQHIRNQTGYDFLFTGSDLKNQIKAELAQVTVTGKVVDELGQPLMSVTVKQMGTSNATATDAKGQMLAADI